jgi:hypothetical protein
VTFLELVQALHTDVGAAGNAPAAVTSQRGENARLVKWIQDADWYIQSLFTRWKFLRTAWSHNTVAATYTVTKPAALKQWDFETFMYDESPLEVVEYHKVRSEFFDTTITGPPSRIVVMPDKSLRIEPVPDAVYTITADYYATPTRLAANADVSDIPEEFHMAILGRAMILYANYEGAQEIKAQGSEIYGEFFSRLFDDQIPSEENAAYKGTGGSFEVIAE